MKPIRFAAAAAALLASSLFASPADADDLSTGAEPPAGGKPFSRASLAPRIATASYRFSGVRSDTGEPLAFQRYQGGLGAALELEAGAFLTRGWLLSVEATGGFQLAFVGDGAIPHASPYLLMGGGGSLLLHRFLAGRELHVFGGLGVDALEVMGNQDMVGAPDNILRFELVVGPTVQAGIGWVLPKTPVELGAKLQGGYLRGTGTELVPLNLVLRAGVAFY